MILKSALQNYNSNRILEKGEDYIYILPNELLKSYISHYTITFPNKSMMPENYTVIPNGGSTLVFTFDGNKIGNELFGAATKINIVGGKANNAVLVLIISFQPWGLVQFIKMNQLELTDLLLPFETVELTLYNSIYKAFEQSENVYELLTELDKVFFAYVNGITVNAELSLAIEKIMNTNGIISVKELSNHVYYSERHLNRIFTQNIGMNIKTFMRLVRINKAIKLLQNSGNTLTQTAQQAGFYDHPHFINEFKTICNISPQEYLKNMSDFYNEISKP